MAETKPSDQAEKQLKAQETKPLESSDAHALATPTAQDKQIAESDRTNQSSGSLTELALKSKGLTKEQIAAQMEAQGDSISIDYGNGQEASRKTGLTEKSLIQVGGKTYDAKSVVAYDLQTSSDIVSDATNATAPVQEQDKITLKPVEVAPTLIKAGLDYNEDRLPFGQKLANFVQSAEARLMDPEGQKAYVQGLIDKVIGIGQGLNEAKDEVKTNATIAAKKAWTALNDGSVASFLAQPNAINEPLFKTLGTCFDAMRKDPNAVNNVLAIMGRELEAANDKYSKMTPQERGVQDGKAMFWFINPAGSTEAADITIAKLEPMIEPVIAPIDAALVKNIERSVQAIREISKTSLEVAQKAKQMLLDYINGEGLYGRKLVGIPDGYFDGMKPTEPIKTSDTINAMSKADDLEGKPLPGKGGASEQLQEKDIVNPIDRNASLEKKIAQLEALSRENEPLAKSFLERIDAQLGTKSETNFKTAQDIADKAKRPSIKDEKDWFDVEHVRDAFRFKTPVDNLNDLPKIVEALKASEFKIIKPDLDKLLNPKGRGWRMAAFDLRAPNGQIIEYQVLSKEMNEAGRIEHSTYKAVRKNDVSKLTKAELDSKDKADIAAARLYRSAQEAYQKRTGQNRQAIQKIINDTEKVFTEGEK